MKNFLIIIFMLLTAKFYGQWVPLSYQPQFYINDITCVSEDIVFAGGKDGNVIKTIDGGATWLP